MKRTALGRPLHAPPPSMWELASCRVHAGGSAPPSAVLGQQCLRRLLHRRRRPASLGQLQRLRGMAARENVDPAKLMDEHALVQAALESRLSQLQVRV